MLEDVAPPELSEPEDVDADVDSVVDVVEEDSELEELASLGEVVLVSLPPPEPYPSAYQPPPLRWKLVLEMSFEMLPSFPQDGQTEGGAALRLCNFSKTFSHSAHLNSYNGMMRPRSDAREDARSKWSVRARTQTKSRALCLL